MAHKSAKYDAPPPCGLFIRISDHILGLDLVRALREIFFVINHGKSDYAKNSHIVFFDSQALKALDKDQCQTLIEIAKSQGIVALLDNDIEKTKEFGADGVLLGDINDVEKARKALTDNDIVGLRCGIDIDLGELAVEKGADFVSFHTSNNTLVDPKLAAIWSTLSDMPCLMEGPFTNDYVDAYIRSGASFIEASYYIWDHKQGVKQGTVNMIHAIELSLQEHANAQSN